MKKRKRVKVVVEFILEYGTTIEAAEDIGITAIKKVMNNEQLSANIFATDWNITSQ